MKDALLCRRRNVGPREKRLARAAAISFDSKKPYGIGMPSQALAMAGPGLLICLASYRPDR